MGSVGHIHVLAPFREAAQAFCRRNNVFPHLISSKEQIYGLKRGTPVYVIVGDSKGTFDWNKSQIQAGAEIWKEAHIRQLPIKLVAVETPIDSE